MQFEALAERYWIHRLPLETQPLTGKESLLVEIRLADHLTRVTSRPITANVTASNGPWRAVKVAGNLDFAEVGILAAITKCLAAAGVSVFALSSYDTDVILVREPQWQAALDALGSTWDVKATV